MEEKDSKQELKPQEKKMRPEEMPEYQDELSQSVIRAGRKAGYSDERILDGLRAFL